jgi:hypothetical protein
LNLENGPSGKLTVFSIVLDCINLLHIETRSEYVHSPLDGWRMLTAAGEIVNMRRYEETNPGGMNPEAWVVLRAAETIVFDVD